MNEHYKKLLETPRKTDWVFQKVVAHLSTPMARSLCMSIGDVW